MDKNSLGDLIKNSEEAQERRRRDIAAIMEIEDAIMTVVVKLHGNERLNKVLLPLRMARTDINSDIAEYSVKDRRDDIESAEIRLGKYRKYLKYGPTEELSKEIADIDKAIEILEEAQNAC